MDRENKETLIQLIECCPNEYSINDIMKYLLSHTLKASDNYYALDIYRIINDYIYNIILNDIYSNKIIRERASYIETYLEGNMYKEDRPEYKEIQKAHATCIKELAEHALENKVQEVLV